MTTHPVRPSRPGAQNFLPATDSLELLARAAADCRGCELFRDATQTVFGAGPSDAELVLIGEQPGDAEDKQGVPFVGPAGKLLRSALKSAEIDVGRVYLTNAVKHFRWRPAASGPRRLHEKPSQGHVTACRPWLTHELNAIRPKVVVALGAVAAQSILGSKFTLTHSRGQQLDWPADYESLSASALFATIHPSAVLRTPSLERATAMEALIADLAIARQAL
ncbi:MAG: uracil-DNA glycosylase [Frankiales bacterium]|nr:uracil-DNA glycosylase [Frankiales bacterium]